MNKENFESKLKEINEEINKIRQEKIKVLCKEYLEANNTYKVGDVISDHRVTIKITKIYCEIGYMNLPTIIYRGNRVRKKDHVEIKSKSVSGFETIYINNIKN